MLNIHPSADVSPQAELGENTRIWHGAQIRERVRIGANCIIGKNVYVDFEVQVGNNVKVQNNCSLYHGLEIEDGVFIGPHVVFTNDRFPRSINADGTLKGASDWVVGRTRVCYGAAIGAGSIIVTGVTIGRWAMVGAGAVVTRDVPDCGLVAGTPARLIGYISAGGERCATQEEAIQRSEQEALATTPA